MQRKTFSALAALLLTCAPSLFAQKDLKSILDAAKTTTNKREYSELLRIVNQSIELHPDEPINYLRRAEYYDWTVDTANILADVKKAISLQPDNEGVLMHAARVLYYANLFDEGLKIADVLFSKDKKSITAYRIRYLERFGKHDYEGTIHDILAIGDLYAKADDDGRLYSDADGNLIRPASILSVTLDHLQDDPNIYDYYGKLFRIIEVQRDGPSTTGSSLMRYLAEVNLYINYARLYEAKRSQSEIAVFWERLASDRGLCTRASVYKGLEKYENAINDLTKLLENDHEDVAYLIERGELNVLAGRLTEAISDFEAAKRLDPDLSEMDLTIEKIKKLIDGRSAK